MRPISHIVIHTAGASHNGKAVDQTFDDIRNYHMRAKGWTDIGYHRLIRFDGKIYNGRPVQQKGAGVEGFNSRSLHICCTGHGDIEDFTPQQYKSAIGQVVFWLDQFNLIGEFRANMKRVLGHRECYALPGVPNTHKTCPGNKVSMREFRLKVLAELDRLGFTDDMSADEGDE